MHQISYSTLFCALAADLPDRGAALLVAYPDNAIGPLLAHMRPHLDRILAVTPELLAGLPGLAASPSSAQRVLMLAARPTERLSPPARGIDGQPPRLLRFRAIADVLGHLTTPRLLYLAPAPGQAELLKVCRVNLACRSILVWVDLPENEDGSRALAVLSQDPEIEVFGLTATGTLRADPAPGEARVLLGVPRRGWDATGLRNLASPGQTLAEAALPAHLLLPAQRALSPDLLKVLGHGPRRVPPLAAQLGACRFSVPDTLFCHEAPLENGMIAYRARRLSLSFQPPMAGDVVLRLFTAAPPPQAAPINLTGRIGESQLQFRWQPEGTLYHATAPVRIEAAHHPLRLDLRKAPGSGVILIRALDLERTVPLPPDAPRPPSHSAPAAGR